MAKTLIHIGYHKTASTWLQHELFDKEEYGFKRFFSKKEIREDLITVNSLVFNAQVIKDKDQKLTASSNLVSVLSNERLSGNPHSGGYDSKEIAQRLKASFPDAKILIVIREQESAIASSYLQYVKFGGACSLKDYLEPPHRGGPILPLFDFEFFNYYNLVKEYTELFGKDNVLILPFELFKEKPQDFCQKIFDFTENGIKPELDFNKVSNKRLSFLMSNFARAFNMLFVKSVLNPAAIGTPWLSQNLIKIFIGIDRLIPGFIKSPFDKILKRYIKGKVESRYKEGNTKLSELIDINLKEFGYN